MTTLEMSGKGIKGHFRNMRVYLPVPDRLRREYLALVQNKVSHYQPKIEAKTGIQLGDVKVKDRSEHLDDKLLDYINKSIIEHGPDVIFHPFFGAGLCLVRSGTVLNTFLDNLFNSPLMVTEGTNIYIPFNMARRIKFFWENDFSVDDYAVVHELSHVLWKKLEGENDSEAKSVEEGIREMRKSSSWNEGFATYCHAQYFRDLYPKGYKPGRIPESYKTAAKKVERLVGIYGPDILFQIPQHWKSIKEAGKSVKLTWPQE